MDPKPHLLVAAAAVYRAGAWKVANLRRSDRHLCPLARQDAKASNHKTMKDVAEIRMSLTVWSFAREVVIRNNIDG